MRARKYLLLGRAIFRLMGKDKDIVRQSEGGGMAVSTPSDIQRAKEEKYEESEETLKKFIDGSTTASQLIDRLNAPIEVRVESDHPLMMEDPLKDKGRYLPLQTDRFESAGEGSLRIKDNPLAREVLSSGKLNVLDERIEITGVGNVEAGLVGQGRIE